MLSTVSMQSTALAEQQLQLRFRGFTFAFAGAFSAILAVYWSPQFPGPSLDPGSLAFWLLLSIALALAPGALGLLTPKLPRSVTFLLGMVSGYCLLQAVIFSTRTWGPYDSDLFRWLYFG